MAHRRRFYLYKRHKAKGEYWYVCFLDKETGRQMTAKSIDCLKERMGIMDFAHITRKEEAAVIANKALESGIIFSNNDNILFEDWCRDFWSWDKSEYIALRNNLQKNSIGKEYAYNMLKNFEKNIVPLIPKGLKLVNVTTQILDKMTKALYKTEKTSGTIKVIIYSFSIPLKEAYRLGLILHNPADKLLTSSGNEKDRGVLTKEELGRIVRYLNDHKNDIFPSYRLGILLAASTGMRLSEIRAVNTADFVECEVNGYEKLLIRHSIGYLSGVKGTKGKYDRAILVDREFAEEIKNNANSKGVAFPSSRESRDYMSAPALRIFFYEVLEAIGIKEEERIERNITFHSLRHSFSTLSRDYEISQEDRMLVLGHKSTKINDRYTHSTDEALERVSKLSTVILSGEKTSAEKGAENGVF